MVNYKFQRALMDDKLKYSIDEDFNMIQERIYLRGLLKIISIFV